MFDSARRAWRGIFVLTLAALSLPALAPAATPRVHAIVGARIVTGPGQVIEHGTIVMRDGIITAVGANVTVPADARVWPGDSLTVYPGMIDAFVMPAEAPGQGAGFGSPFGRRPQAAPAPPRGAVHDLISVHPETQMSDEAPLGKDQKDALRAAGFTTVQFAPRTGILRGQSAVVELNDGEANGAVLKDDAAQVFSFDAQRDGYPGSLMGAIAVVRQSFLDAKWYRDAHVAYAKTPQGVERPQTNLAWESMQSVIAGKQPALFVVDEMLDVLRAAAVAHEAGVTAMVLGAGDEYKRAKEIAATGVPLVVPVNFPDPPDVSDADQLVDLTTEDLRQWNDAPGNAATLAKNGITFALTTNGMKDVKLFRANVSKAIDRGWKSADALAAVTTTPAKLLGLSERIGTIAAGKIANLTVTRGDLFSDKGKVVQVWVDGGATETGRDDQGMRGTWSLNHGTDHHTLTVAADRDTTVKLTVGADTLKATQVRLQGERLRFVVQRGSEAPETFELVEKYDVVHGTVTSGGQAMDLVGARTPEPEGRGPGMRGGFGGPRGMMAGGGAPDSSAARRRDAPVVTPIVMGNTEAWRNPQPAQPAVLLIRNATIWTAGPQGTLQGADMLIKAGKIAAIGKGLAAPTNAVVVDAAGKQVAPGIIDEHSHAAILGNVNECTNSVTCEVRIQDVINSESENIYRQLAGGTTIMHLLHGSCNAIGGQLAIIKNKWGAAPDQLYLSDAPPTVKFALGENPKQSNFGNQRPEPPRYPQSRAGVEQVIRDAFTRARDYKAQWAEWSKTHKGLPPRRDLQLDALAQIVDGKMLIHVHSYRQDEILMLMRLCEEFGFHVNTFTHILEGYKVADEIAATGASALGFTDWWNYKYEVVDAIPYNAYIMWDRGVNVGFNSDDAELARRLNSEASKAIKYGGVPPEEAIKFVTLNPAISLKIDKRVGSLEVGKDADFSIWTGSPISPYSTCLETWIDGRKYFDRAADIAGRDALAKERTALIDRARAAKADATGGGGPPGAGGPRRRPPRYLEDTDMSGNDCGNDGHDMPFMSESERIARQNGEVHQ